MQLRIVVDWMLREATVSLPGTHFSLHPGAVRFMIISLTSNEDIKSLLRASLIHVGALGHAQFRDS